MKVYAAGYAGKFPNFSARICVSNIRFVSEIILAILGCSRMLLMFGTSQLNQNTIFLCDVTRLQSMSEDHSIHSVFSCPGVDSSFSSVYLPRILSLCVKLGILRLTNTKQLERGKTSLGPMETIQEKTQGIWCCTTNKEDNEETR